MSGRHVLKVCSLLPLGFRVKSGCTTTEHITIDTQYLWFCTAISRGKLKNIKKGPMIPDPVNSSAYSPFLLSSFPYYKDGPLQLRGSYPSTKGRKKKNRSIKNIFQDKDTQNNYTYTCLRVVTHTRIENLLFES